MAIPLELNPIIAATQEANAGGPQDVPPTPPAPQVQSLTDLYVKARAQGMDDTNAALSVAQHLRSLADARADIRGGGDIISGRTPDPSYRAQLMAEANAPLMELEQRRKAPEFAAAEVGRQLDVAGKDIALRQQVGLLDPRHPTNVVTRGLLAKMGIPVPDNTIAAALPPELQKQLAPLVEAQTKRLVQPAESAEKFAGAARSRAEAAKTAALTGPEAAKTTAEAGKAEAEAAHTRMLTSGEVAPGYARGGIPIDEEDAKKINGEYQDKIESQQAIDKLLKLVGDENLIKSPKRVAKIAPRVNALIGKLRSSIGMRQLAGPEMKFAHNIINDPTQITADNVVSSLLGVARNQIQFKTLRDMSEEHWNAIVKAKDLRPHGTAATGTTNTAGTSADDAAALEWAKAHPDDPRAARIMRLAAPKVAAK